MEMHDLDRSDPSANCRTHVEWAMNPSEVAEYWEANAEAWTRLARAGYDISRDALNTPAFLAMLPAVGGLDGLDVGSGEGSNTRHLARLGARMSAVDIAPTFIRHAQDTEKTDPLGIVYQVGDGMALPFADGSFDFVTAFMSLMDMPDPGRALQETHRVLRPGGFLQFSILHPCFATPHRKVLREAGGTVHAIEIGGYFDATNELVDTWCFSTVPREDREKVAPFRTPVFHRTLSGWVEIICRAGLVIEQLGEPCATEELALAEPVVADTRVAPLFLHVRAIRPDLSGSKGNPGESTTEVKSRFVTLPHQGLMSIAERLSHVDFEPGQCSQSVAEGEEHKGQDQVM
jgi:SAM-dependent methyltransferase